jgi:5-bromo-4-chloroindolyl phosphate hydrolysis protein
MHDFVIRAEDYLTQVDEYLTQIYSPTVKESLMRLSVILRQIFVCVREPPEKVRLTRQLMNYYIPSTIKLLSTYDDLEKQPIQGENIQTTRKEIESSLVTINNSLETMFDELFQEEAMDISSDIQVLNAILERDGWKENTFKSNQKMDI